MGKNALQDFKMSMTIHTVDWMTPYAVIRGNSCAERKVRAQIFFSPGSVPRGHTVIRGLTVTSGFKCVCAGRSSGRSEAR